MRDWTPLTAPTATGTASLATALSLVEHATGEPATWNERQSWLGCPLSPELRLVLHVPTLTWQIVDARDRKKSRLAAAGTALPRGLAWLSEATSDLDLPTPDGTLTDAVASELNGEDAELLTAWLASAHQVLSLLAGTDPGWSSVHTQSHPLRSFTTHAGSNITLAVELAGPLHHEPAFTVTQPQRDVTELHDLVCGAWLPEHHGAVLSTSALEASGQREQVVSFIADALGQLQS